MKVSTTGLAGGDAGVTQTLARMAQLANDGQKSPVVVNYARLITLGSGQWQGLGAARIFNFLARVWRYVDDPVDTELLVSPDEMLNACEAQGVIMGDCDEAAILGAALGKAVGIAATFTVLAFATDPDRFAHVYATLLPTDGPPVDLDVTRPPGRVPPVTRVVVSEV